MLLCLCVGKIDYVKRTRSATTSYITGGRPPLPSTLSAESARLISDMWATDIRARPSSKQVLQRLEECKDPLAAADPTSSVVKNSEATSIGTAKHSDAEEIRRLRNVIKKLQAEKAAEATSPRIQVRIPAHLVIDSTNLQLGAEVGGGKFSTVTHATYAFGGEARALVFKAYHRSTVSDASGVASFQREIEVMTQVSGHPNILKLFGASSNASSTCGECALTNDKT